MRTLIVGDVHGCLQEFDLLLEKVEFHPGRDRLILVGDLINKGPDSRGVLERAFALKAEVVMGNHELALLRSSQTETYPRELINWMQTWPSFIEDEHFIVVHGGLVPDCELAQTPVEKLATIRHWQDRPWYEYYRENKLVVFGHWAANGLVWRENAIGLDTGCVYGKKLSCLILPSRQLVQVDALDVYAPITSLII